MHIIRALVGASREVARLGLYFVVCIQLILPASAWAAIPEWWARQGVLTAGVEPDNYAVANQGQVKNIAKKAYRELKLTASGPGAELDGIWANAGASVSDYNAVNIGQLKNVAQPFYDRLGLQMPLLAGVTPDNYALANIGQVKNLFSFSISDVSPDLGMHAYIYKGDMQSGSPGDLLSREMVVRVVDYSGAAVSGVVVEFSALDGGVLNRIDDAVWSGEACAVITDALGCASVKLMLKNSLGVTRLRASVVGKELIFIGYSSALVSVPGGFDMPSDPILGIPQPGGTPLDLNIRWGAMDQSPRRGTIEVGPGDGGGEDLYSTAVISWDSNGSVIIQRRTNLGDWEDIHSGASEGSYEDDGRLCGEIYEYRIRIGGLAQVIPLTASIPYYVPMIRSISLGDNESDGEIGVPWQLYEGYSGQQRSVSESEGEIAHYDYYTIQFWGAVSGLNRSWFEMVDINYQGEDEWVGRFGINIFFNEQEQFPDPLPPEYSDDDSETPLSYTVIIWESNLIRIGYLGEWIPAYAFSSLPEDKVFEVEKFMVDYPVEDWIYGEGRGLSFEWDAEEMSASRASGSVLHDGDIVEFVTPAGRGGSLFFSVMPVHDDLVDISYGLSVGSVAEEDNSDDFIVPVNESSGAKYRKIALNGAPLSDEKPQSEPESDQSKEETFVDALTLGLRHEVTDSWIPVPASDLFVGVRRNSASEVWNLRRGLRPVERWDRPFGLGWSANVTASIEIKTLIGIAEDRLENPDTATVTDESGTVYEFAIHYGGTGYDPDNGYSGVQTFIPIPSSRSDQSAHQVSLVRDGAAFVFRKKYGSVLTFESAGINASMASDRIDVGASGHSIRIYRLTTLEDRFGNFLDYVYEPDANTIIPMEISPRGKSGMSIYIKQNVNGLITDIWEGGVRDGGSWVSGGRHTSYSYEYHAAANAYYLYSVTYADGSINRYGYHFQSEQDQSPPEVDFYHQPKLHWELSTITDPLMRVYSIQYALDHSKYDLFNGGHYVKTGLPMQVSRVDMPEGVSSQFINGSFVKLNHLGEGQFVPALGFFRSSTVIDANGNKREYVFGGMHIEQMLNFKSAYFAHAKLDVPTMIYYQSMEVLSYEKLDDDTQGLLDSETFNFLPSAGMALGSVTDFSGNTTSYIYGTSFNNSIFTSIAGGGLSLYGFYADPTEQINALGQSGGVPGTRKYFTYGKNRVMNSMTNENGTVTRYRLDSEARPSGLPIDHHSSAALLNGFGRRLSETVTDVAGKVLSHTTYDFPDTFQDGGVDYPAGVSLNFVTRKTVHKLSSATNDPLWVSDLVTIYVPDANSRVAKEIVDPQGLALVTEYSYEPNGNKRTTKDPRNNTTTFSYDKRNRLTHVTYQDAHQRRFYYDGRGNKTAEIDEKGVATFWRYDDLNRIKDQVVDMDGSLAALASSNDYVLDGSVALDRSVHIVTSYSYNKLNAKVSIIGPKLTAIEGSPSVMRTTETKLEYDALQRLRIKTEDYGATSDHLNYITTYEYDVTKNTGGSVFDSSGFKPTKVTDPRGYVTEVTYDELYRPVEEKVEYEDDLYATTLKDYDEVGNLRFVADALGKQTETVYDGLRRPITVIQSLGTDSEVINKTEYTSTGLAWKQVEAFGSLDQRETLTEYDDAGRPVKVFAPAVVDALSSSITPVNPVTETIYDAAGNVAAVIDARTRRTDYTYDSRNRRHTEQLPAVTDATTGLISRPTRVMAYDGVGNVIAVQDARGFVTTTEYDHARRPFEVVAPPMTKMDGSVVHPTTVSTYDGAGNVLTVTDANGHVTTNTYDALNRLKTTKQSPTSNSADDIVVENIYDAAGNRTAVLDGKQQRTEFTYDGLNRNTSIKDPALRLVTFEFNALNKTARVDSENRRTEYRYDDRHRLEHVIYVETGDVEPYVPDRTYEYDDLSRILSVTETGKSGKTDVAYTYDALGRQESETSSGKTHEYAYDLVGNRITVTYGGTGTVLTSTYDALNRLETLTENARVTTYGYDLNGNRVYQELPSGEEVATQFDPLDRAIAITTSKAAGALLLQLGQVYDPVGNLVKLNERHYGSSLAPRVVTNTYDNVNRLILEANAEGAKTITTEYRFDTANNRKFKEVVTTSGGASTTVTTDYEYNNLNQLETATEGAVVTSFTYDYNGNRITRAKGEMGDVYVYDYENRLVSLVKGAEDSPEEYAYEYDYRTRRVERVENEITTKIVFSGGVSVAEYSGEDSDLSTITAEYIRGSDWGGGVGGLLYSVRSGVPSFKHYNSRGDVISETNDSGVATWQGTYETFGTRTRESGSTQDRQKANTKEEDPTGLLNEGFRYRCLETGVFITRDPLGFVDGPNMYAYVVQNPWSKFDPLGLATEDERKENAKESEAEAKDYDNEARSEESLAQEHFLQREDDYQKHKVLGETARRNAEDMRNRADILANGTEADYRKRVLDAYGSDNPDLNSIMAFYADQFNDEATLAFLANQRPAERPTLDFNSVALMLLAPQSAGVQSVMRQGPVRLPPAPNPSIQFGKVQNQISHTFRHIKASGFTAKDVQSAVENHLNTVRSQIQAGKPFNQIIEVGGKRLQYTAYKLPDGTINVGRIHPAP